MMSDLIRRIFRIHKGEGLKVLHFILLGVLLQAGIAIGISLTDTLFLVNIGVERLPVVYMIMPLVMIVFTPIYSYLVRRYGIDKIFHLMLGQLAIGGIFIFLLTYFPRFLGASSLLPAVFYMAKIYTFLWYITLYTTYWSFIDRFFDILDAKRLFALFSGGLATGGMLGGAFVRFFTGFSQAEFLFLVWSSIAFLTIPLLRHVKKRWHKIDEIDVEGRKRFAEETGYVLKAMKNSRYVLLINLVMFSTIFLTTVCEFQYMEFFSQGRDTQELASLFGQLFVAASALNLIIDFFLFNRMISFIGVRNMTLAQPLVYLLAFTLFLYRYGHGAAFFGFLAYQGFLISVDSNNWNFIYNAVPSEIKTSVRAFVENLCDPLATAAAGLSLLFLAPLFTPQQMALFGVFGTVIVLLFALLLRNDYLRAMITNLKREWLDFSKPEEEVLKDIGDRELEQLENYALNEDMDTAYTAINFLWLRDRSAALKALLEYFAQSSGKDRVELSPLFEIMLQDEDDEVVRELMYWLEGKDLDEDPVLIEALGSYGLIQPEKLLPLLKSSNLSEQGAAATSLLNNWNIDHVNQAVSVLNSLIKGTDEQKRIAIKSLGKSKQERYAHFLASYLQDSDIRIRQEALQSIFRLVNRDSNRLIPHLLEAIRIASEEERIMGIDALEKIGDSECIVPLLLMSKSFSPNLQRRIERLILTIGLQSVPTIVSVLRGTQYTTTVRSIAARALSKLAFPQFEMYFTHIVNTVITRAYEFLYYSDILQKEGETVGFSVLAKDYKATYTRIIEFVLELLSIGGRLPDFELISSSLRSNNLKVRANAIETIEQGISRDIFKSLLPLIDSRSIEEIIRFFRSNFPIEEITSQEITQTALDSEFPLECSAAAQILWETSPSDVYEKLRKKLMENKTPLFQETVLSLLSSSQSATRHLNIVEKIHYLSQSPFFESFIMKELMLIAQGAVEVHFDIDKVIYKQGDPANAFYYIIAGEVLIMKDNQEKCTLRPQQIRRYAGDCFGEGTFFGETGRDETVYSKGSKVLAIYGTDVADYAKIYPKIAIELLKNKLMYFASAAKMRK
jgi:HEAT repeat protein